MLTQGAVLPAAPSSLAEAPSSSSAADGVLTASAGAVLAAVASAAERLDGPSATRLLAAAAAYAGRQPARSSARVACIRMQHGLLTAATQGESMAVKLRPASKQAAPHAPSTNWLPAPRGRSPACTAQRLRPRHAQPANQPTNQPTSMGPLLRRHLLRGPPAGRLVLDDGAVTSWLSPLPKLLWELGEAAPATSSAALRLMLDAARFAPAGGSAQHGIPCGAAAEPSPSASPSPATCSRAFHRERGVAGCHIGRCTADPVAS